jgi:RNA polymerase sigma factor (sigma-70 family)
MPSTQWSLVLAARGEGLAADAALSKLCRLYWLPVYALIRRRRPNPADAQELTQQFFADVIASEDLARLNPEVSSFRSWLYVAVRNALNNDWHYRTAKKRDERKLAWMDADTAEAAYSALPRQAVNPERLFDHTCAVAIYSAARERARRELFTLPPEVFDVMALEPGAVEPAHGQLAQALGVSVNTFNQKVWRARAKFRTILYRQIAETVATADQIPDEIRFVCEALSPPRE